MPSVHGELRHTLRSLRRTPGFTCTAILVLAVGIGLNVSLFALVNALLLKPLGGEAPGALAGVYARERERPDRYRRFSYPEYVAVRDSPGALSHLLAQELAMASIALEAGTSRQVSAALVSATYFSTLAVRPAIGREFGPEDERVGAPAVAIVSDAMWRQLGGGAIAGRTIRVSGRDVAIVGVTPPGFSGATALFAPDIWLPLGACAYLSGPSEGAEAAGCLGDPNRRTLTLVGRLKPGVSREMASASLAAVAPAVAVESGAQEVAHEVVVGRLSRLSIGSGPSGDSEVATVMWFLSGLAACVLLIASLNLANMLLARAMARRREVAIRLALGSSRLRIVGTLLAESSILALAAAGIGLALAVAGTRILALRAGSALAGGAFPLGVAFQALPDARVLGATLAFALLAGLGCGIWPAVGLARSAALSHLRDQAGQAFASTGGLSPRNALVVSQLAVSLALLTAAGLFTMGAIGAARSDAGFPLDGGIVATVSADSSGYDEAGGRQAYARVLARVRVHPGVASASLATSVPFGLDSSAGSVRDAARGDRGEARVALVSAVGADYFESLGMRLLRGREFTEMEEASPAGSRPAVVDQVLAGWLWPGLDPIGQRLQLQGPEGEWPESLHVVGVAPATRESLFDTRPPARVYVPWGSRYAGQAHVHVRMRPGGPAAEASMVRAVRDAVRQADAALAVVRVSTMRGLRDGSVHLLFARAGAGLFACFGLSALLLAALGVYGLKSYLVSQRGREIAIRMALGANRRDVLRLVSSDGAVLTACGVAVGLAFSAVLTRAVAGWVYGAGEAGVLPVAASTATLAAAVLLASYLPVRRAAARSTWTALRTD